MSGHYEVPIIAKKAIAPGATEITLDISKTDFRFTAGQYATITLPHATDQPTTSQFHDFSIVSSPNDHMLLKIAFRNSVSFFKNTLLASPLGSSVILEGPSGNFTLPNETDKPIIFIAGGIGITPFLSMLTAISETKQPYRIILFYSNRDVISTPYTAELQQLAKDNPSLKLVLTMVNDLQWKGETRTIESSLTATYAEGELSNYLFYIAGPPAMVFALKDDLSGAGIADANLHTEGFTGLEIEQVLTGEDYNALISSLDQTALVSMTDAKGHIVYANQRFVEVSKYSLDDLLGQNHRILKSGHQPDRLFDELWQTISSGKVWRGEIENKAKDGTYYWVDTSIAPILGVNNIPERYISVRFLITERKEKEETLSGLLLALDKTALVSMTDAKGRIVYANQRFVDVSKYPLYELMGQDHKLLKSGMQPDALFINLWDTISHGKVWRGEIKNKTKDDTYYWIDMSVAPIMGAGGRPERYISIGSLVTDKKEWEQSLQQTKAMDDAILSSIVEGLIAADQTGKIILVNPEAEQLLGWDANQALSLPIEELLVIEDSQGNNIPVQDQPFRQVLTTKKKITVSSNYYFVRRNGEKFPVTVSAAPIKRGNEIVGVVETFREVTE